MRLSERKNPKLIKVSGYIVPEDCHKLPKFVNPHNIRQRLRFSPWAIIPDKDDQVAERP